MRAWWGKLLVMGIAAAAVGCTWLFAGENRWVAWGVTGTVGVASLGWAALAALRRRRQRRQQAPSLPSKANQAFLRAAADAKQQIQREARRRGGRGLYHLPCYLLMGAPKAGKSALLRAAGLSPHQPTNDDSRSQQPAAACTWWFGRDLVFLETASGFEEPADRDGSAWIVLLRWLRRHRPRLPLDGVLVAVDAAELVGKTEAAQAAQARQLRSQLEELTRETGWVPPVYLVVTKHDQVPYFSEFWSSLTDAQAGQLWGLCLGSPSSRKGGERIANELQERFDELSEVLHERAVAELSTGPSRLRQLALLRFPEQLRQLRPIACRMLDELGRRYGSQELPMLRGLYFTSALPPGASSAGEARTAALGGPENGSGMTRIAVPVRAQGHFVQQLFHSLLQADRGAGGESKALRKRARWRTSALGAGAVAVTALATLPAAVGYGENVELIEETSRMLKCPHVDITGELDALRAHREALGASGSGIRYWWGSYAAPALYQASEQHYLECIRGYVGMAREELASRLQALGEAQPLAPLEFKQSYEDFETGYQDLELYLVLAHPERLLEREDPPAAASQFTRTLLTGHPEAGTTPDSGTAPHVAYFLLALSQRPEWGWSADEALVGRVRVALRREIREISYRRLKAAGDTVPPIEASEIFRSNARQYIHVDDGAKVGGWFTAEGWAKIRKVSETPWRAWVLGFGPEDTLPWGKKQLWKRYFEDYQREWEDFLSALEIERPKAAQLKRLAGELKVLGQKVGGPYTSLFDTFVRNVRLEMPRDLASALRGAADAGSPTGLTKRPKSPVAEHFRGLVRFATGAPSELNQYLDGLRRLELTLRQAGQRPELGEAHETAAIELEDSVTEAMRELRPYEQELLEPLLLNLIRHSIGVGQAPRIAQLNRRWYQQIYLPYKQLRRRFPFKGNANSDVPLADFERFFGDPEGLIWEFYNRELSPQVIRTGDQYEEDRRAKQFKPGLTRCLNAARKITDTMMPDGQSLHVAFAATLDPIPGVDTTEFSFGRKQAAKYENGPRGLWKSEDPWWPGASQAPGARISIQGGGGVTDKEERQGPFALFRLLASGKLAGRADGPLTARWRLHNGRIPVAVHIHPKASAHPFRAGFFAQLKCPSIIR